MGTVIHRAVLVTTREYRDGGLPDMDAFRAKMPEELRGLVLGPIPAAVNGYVNYVFLPSGSKIGFDTYEDTREWQRMFRDLFRTEYDDGSTPDETASVKWGSDLGRKAAKITDWWPQNHRPL